MAEIIFSLFKYKSHIKLKTKEEGAEGIKDTTMIKDTRSGTEGYFNGTLNTPNEDKNEKNVGNSCII